jgi:hypothetical protein
MSKKKENNMETSVTIKEENLPAELQGGWGVVEDLETTDLLVPKIYQLQAMSKFVADGVARAGDFADSLTGEVLAKKDDALEVIIFGSYKTLLVSKEVLNGKFEYQETLTVTPQNAKEIASLPMIEDRADGKYKNSLYYNFYCLLPAKIEELPFVLSLGSTKTKAARKLNTMIYKLAQMRKPGAAVVFNLKSVSEKNDQGSWFGLDISQGRDTTQQELLRAHAWYVKSKSQKFTVVEEEQAVADAHDVSEPSF